MNKTYYTFPFIILLITISFSACSPAQKRSNRTIKTDAIEIQNITTDSIKLVSNEGIEFQYSLGKTTKSGENEFVELYCTVQNLTNEERYYLNESCNGLEYRIINEPKSYQIAPLRNCNASWIMISKLEPKGTLEFKTQIQQPKNAAPIEKIGIDFRTVDQYIPFETLKEHPELVNQLYRQQLAPDFIIWGK